MSELCSIHYDFVVTLYTVHVSNGQSLATMLARCHWSSGQVMRLCGLGAANSKSIYYRFFSSCQELELLGASTVSFTRYRSLPCLDTSHLD